MLGGSLAHTSELFPVDRWHHLPLSAVVHRVTTLLEWRPPRDWRFRGNVPEVGRGRRGERGEGPLGHQS